MTTQFLLDYLPRMQTGWHSSERPSSLHETTVREHSPPTTREKPQISTQSTTRTNSVNFTRNTMRISPPLFGLMKQAVKLDPNQVTVDGSGA